MKNNFLKKFRIKGLILIVFTLSLFFLIFPKQSYATTHYCGNVYGCNIYLRFVNPNNVKWQVHYYNFQDSDYNSMPNGNVYTPAYGTGDVYDKWIAKGTAYPNTINVSWYTSCADPATKVALSNTTIIGNIYASQETAYYNVSAPAFGCHNPGGCSTSGYYDANYAACLYLPQNGETVNLNNECPQNHNPQYCAYGGNIYGFSNCGVTCNTTSSCTGTCHQRGGNACSTSYCVSSTWTDNSCTAGCASPPTPTPRPSTCSVSWSGSFSNLTPNTNYSASLTLNSASPTWNKVSVYKDGSTTREGGLSTATSFSFNSGAAGTHTLKYYNLDYSGYNSGTGPDSNAPLCGTQSFTTTALPPGTPTLISETTYCSYVTPIVKDLRWTDGANTTSSTAYYCDKTVADPYGGCVPDNGSIDSHRWYRLLTDPFTLIPGHDYLWLVADANAYGHTNSATRQFTAPTCTYNVKTHVYVDYNGNGNQDAGEPDYAPTDYTPSNDITYGGATGANTTVTTGALGIYEVKNIPAGNNNEALRVNPPTGWTVSTAASVTVSGPLALEQTVNFGIHPPAPTCTMTTNQATRYTLPPNNTATLTVNAVKPPTYAGTITYRWFTDLGSVSPTTTTDPTNTATWTAPSPYWDSGTQAKPSAQACITGATAQLCGNCGLGVGTSGPPIIIVPLHSISGFVYTDLNKNAQYNNPPENPYTAQRLKISICASGTTLGTSNQFCATPISTAADGTFTTGAIPALTPGQYLVKLTALPTLPDGSPDPTYSFTGGSLGFLITVGKPCAGEPLGVSCDAPTGNVSNVAFGISNSNVWIQTTGGDIYQSGGISNIEPVSSACGSHMSISSGQIQMPGLMLTGNGSAAFGAGDASLNNWVVGKGIIYPNRFTLPSTTSYSSVAKLVKDAGITTPPALPCASGNYLTGCTLSNNLPSGVYSVAGDLKLTGVSNTYTFPNNSIYTFIITGKLDIETEIHLPVGSGSFALFTASGDITVGGSIGSAFNTTTSNIDGYYSSDQNFIIQGTNDCTVAKDKRLNVSGAIVTNATNTTPSKGSLQVKRDMCDDDSCPTFAVQARPDFVLSAPSYLQSSTIIWKEVAP